MSETLRDTIKLIVKEHLLNQNGLALGQCLTAVGWVGGTLPELYEEDGDIWYKVSPKLDFDFEDDTLLTSDESDQLQCGSYTFN